MRRCAWRSEGHVAQSNIRHSAGELVDAPPKTALLAHHEETGRLGTIELQSLCCSSLGVRALQVSALGQLQNGDLTHHEMKHSRDDALCRQLRVREAHSGAAVERNERVATGGKGVRWAIECGACAVWNSEGHSVAAK